LGFPRIIDVKTRLILVAGIVLLVAALRVPLLGIPFERDEGEYAYIAWRSDFHELPYRDWIDQKPPGIFWVYQAALALPISPICAVHFMGLLFSAASAVALWLLASRFLNRFWAAMSAVVFALLSVDPLVQGTAANTELFMLLPLILSAFLFFRWISMPSPADRRLYWLLTGALIAIATLFKQIAVFNWPMLLLLHGWLGVGPERWRRTLFFAVWSAAGFLAVWGFVAVYFAAHHGLNEFIYNVFTHNLEYIRAIPWASRLKNCLGTLQSLAPSETFTWLLMVTGLVAAVAARKAKIGYFLLAWLLASFVGASASGYYFPHYFQQLLPPLALAAAFGAESIEGAGFWKTIPLGVRRAASGAVLCLLPALVLFPFVFSYSSEEAIRHIYPGNSLFAKMPALGAHVAQITRPEDRLFIFGAEPELFFYAHRESATRYIFLFPLYGPYADAKQKQMETAEEITNCRPAAALYCPNGLFFQRGSEQFFTKWSQHYLDENFHPDTCLTVDNSDVSYLSPADQNSPLAEDQRLTGVLLVRNHAP